MSEAQQRLEVSFYPGQLEAFNVKRRIIALSCGTGWGKTFWGRYKFAQLVSEDPAADYLVFSPSFANFKGTMLGAVIPMFTRDLEWGTYYGGSGANGQIDLHGGGHIYFRSGEAPLSAEGVHPKAIWVDEPGQLGDDAWDVIQRRAARYRAHILLTGYPLSANGWYADLYRRWKAGQESEVHFIQRPSTDNPDYPAEEFERLRLSMPSWKFEQTYMGLFSRAEGVIYPAITPAPLPEEVAGSLQRYGGADYGWVATAAVVIGWHDDHCFVLGAYKAGERPNDQHAAGFRGIGLHETVAVYGDPAAKQSWPDFKQHGINIRPALGGAGSVLAGITRIIGLANEGKLHFVKGAPGMDDLVDEWNAYRWHTDPNGRVLREEPVKENDHLCDALRYAIQSSRPVGQTGKASIGKSPWQ